MNRETIEYLTEMLKNDMKVTKARISDARSDRERAVWIATLGKQVTHLNHMKGWC